MVHWRGVLFYLLSLSACATWLGAQQYPPLADVLQQESIPFPPTSIPDLNRAITSYATLNDSREFAIAYYIADPKTEALQPPLLITRYNKLTGEWSHITVDSSRVEELTKTDTWLGATVDFVRKADRYYLGLHWGPDAGCILVLKTNFTVDDALLGFPQGWFKSGAVLYSKNIVHFADVHQQTLWLYDPDNRESQQLYPQPQDPFRDAFSARLEKVINNDLCGIRNWRCDPQRFSSDFAAIEVNDDTRSLAAQINFEPEGFLDITEALRAQWNRDNYAYIYQLQPFRWREFPIHALKSRFGTDSLKELLTPGKIEEVFATPAPD